MMGNESDFLIDYPFWSAVALVLIGIGGGTALSFVFANAAERFGSYARRLIGDRRLLSYWQRYRR